MYEEPSHLIQRQLGDGEQLLWAGRPVQGLRLTKMDVFLIPFTLLWTGFAVFWEVTALRSGAPLVFALFGVPFVAMGLYITVGRFFADAARRANTCYGVTDRRILTLSGRLGRRARSIDLSLLPQMTLEERSDGRGTIVFGNIGFPFSWFHGTSWPLTGGSIAGCFDTIENARAVHDLIRDGHLWWTTGRTGRPEPEEPAPSAKA